MFKIFRRFLLFMFLIACIVAIPILTLIAFDDLEDLYNRLRQLRDSIYDTQNTNSPYGVMIGHWTATDQSSDLYINKDRLILVDNNTKTSVPLKYIIINAHLRLYTLYIKLVNHSGVALQTELITFSADLKVMTRTIITADPTLNGIYTKSYSYMGSQTTP